MYLVPWSIQTLLWYCASSVHDMLYLGSVVCTTTETNAYYGFRELWSASVECESNGISFKKKEIQKTTLKFEDSEHHTVVGKVFNPLIAHTELLFTFFTFNYFYLVLKIKFVLFLLSKIHLSC